MATCSKREANPLFYVPYIHADRTDDDDEEEEEEASSH